MEGWWLSVIDYHTQNLTQPGVMALVYRITSLPPYLLPVNVRLNNSSNLPTNTRILPALFADFQFAPTLSLILVGLWLG